MYVGTQLQPFTAPPNRTRRWAYLLLFGYTLNLLIEFMMLRFTKGTDGHWVVEMATKLENGMIFLILGAGAFSLICSVGFIISFLRERRFHRERISRWSVTIDDFLHVMAWLQIFTTFMYAGYAFFLPNPIFPEGSIGGVLESASFQLMILVIAAFRFFGRWEVIGFTRPKSMTRMLLAIVGILAFIIVGLDFLLTTPIADWLNLSLQSQRETDIQNSIVQAKTFNWMNGLVSIAVVGIMVPIAEEILFRGVIQTYLVKRFGAVIGVLLTSFWFALMHVDIALFIPLFVIGLGLGFVRHRYNSIWGAIILHSLNNLASAMHYFN
ncbi:CPBP family intramembrane glutamic endopeptidase [Brevibacillus ginsengisoli]|uniref:CPBP family intramembrane glutamic endopeptidase n=1 Tax=Brevibacillus ginsengisoli TaxID=363854 RepID=UPI003CEBED63